MKKKNAYVENAERGHYLRARKQHKMGIDRFCGVCESGLAEGNRILSTFSYLHIQILLNIINIISQIFLEDLRSI